MKIATIQVKNYRCLHDFRMDMGNYSVLIGPNGAGKSSLLYALSWFFEGGTLEPDDIYTFTDANEVPKYTEEELTADPSLDTVEVMVTFTDLTPRDKVKLGTYGKGRTATFRRSWKHSQQTEKVVGNAMQGPGFASIRAMKAVGEFRPAYINLRATIDSLPELPTQHSKNEMLEALTAWENDPTNAARLIVVSDTDANHMFGINGPNIIKECVRMVLIPASGDIVNQVGTNKKGSALNELIGTLMNNAGAAARQDWIDRHTTEIEELTTSMRDSVQASTGLQAERINERLASLVPTAELEFNTDVPSWVPNPTATVRTDVTIDGTTNNIAKQGHGIQRAVMISMFQSLMPDEKLLTGLHVPDGEETIEQSEERLQRVLGDLPALVICIEEPEIYQHPVRARSFARVLSELAAQPNAQVFLATHSPYFIRPAQFESLRRFYLESGKSNTNSTTIAEIVATTSGTRAKVKKTIEMHLPSTFSEGFFSDRVVLVEGGTDKVVLEAIAEKMDRPFDAAGISILNMAGKDGLRIPFVMLDKLGTEAYLVIDGDALGAARKYAGDQAKIDDAHENHRNSTEKIVTWLPASSVVKGAVPYVFEADTVVTSKYTIWNDDIEEELSNWPSFMTSMAAVGGSLRSEKHLQSYKEATVAASLSDMPDSLLKCVEAILGS